MKTELTVERVRALLDYEPSTGVFSWKRRPVFEFPDTRAMKSWNTKHAGKQAGTVNVVNGYVQIGFGERKAYAHRLAFLWMNGAWPSEQVDHINGARADNRWANLRDVPCFVNLQNLKRTKRKDCTTGRLGAFVDKRDGRFQAQIRVQGVVHSLGRYATADEAHEAYLAAKRRLHAGCTL